MPQLDSPQLQALPEPPGYWPLWSTAAQASRQHSFVSLGLLTLHKHKSKDTFLFL